MHDYDVRYRENLNSSRDRKAFSLFLFNCFRNWDVSSREIVGGEMKRTNYQKEYSSRMRREVRAGLFSPRTFAMTFSANFQGDTSHNTFYIIYFIKFV